MLQTRFDIHSRHDKITSLKTLVTYNFEHRNHRPATGCNSIEPTLHASITSNDMETLDADTPVYVVLRSYTTCLSYIDSSTTTR